MPLTSRLATHEDVPLLIPLMQAAIAELQKGFLDPAQIESSRAISAMYTAPAFARRGVGRLILQLCESAAAAEGFGALELMGTLSGRPLYEAAGFAVIEEVLDASGGVAVPLVRMRKALATA